MSAGGDIVNTWTAVCAKKTAPRGRKTSSVSLRDSLAAMDEYKREARNIIGCFLRRGISFPTCISRLDAALARLTPRLTGEQIVPLRALMLHNNEMLMKEMERPGSP